MTRRLGRRQEEQQKQLDRLREQLTETQGRVADFDAGIGTLESTVDSYIGTFQDLAHKGKAAKLQTSRKLRHLHRELDLFVRILEASADRQMEAHRKRKIDELLKTARSKRTPHRKHDKTQRAANDG